MRSGMVEVGTDAARLPSRVVGTSARHRFALAGFALAIAAGFGAPAIADASGLPLEVALAVMLAVGFVMLGWLLGRRVDALTECSLEDPMTHVGNRRHWQERIREEVDRAVRSSMPLSVLLLDVDNLKRLNDDHGHALGDRALALVGDVLLDTCRSRDVPARLGGDEFSLLLPRTRASEAKVVAERIRASLAARRTEVGAPLDRELTVSIGIADLEAVHQPGAEELVASADRALYGAKEGGRDRVVVMAARCISGVISLAEHRKAKDRGIAGSRT